MAQMQPKVSSEVYAYLEDALMTLRSEMQQIEEDVSRAAAFGDLRENRAYEIALQQRSLQQSKIANAQLVLSSVAIDYEAAERTYAKVELMTKVTLGVNDHDQEVVYIVLDAFGDVGDVDESGKQITPDKVSSESRFGRALMDSPMDSIVTYNGKRYTIQKVEPIDYREFLGGA